MKESAKSFNCAHLEAQTAMLFVYSLIRAEGIVRPLLVDSEDADVVVLCAYSASILPGEGCKYLCSDKMARIVVKLHVVTGCDTV